MTVRHVHRSIVMVALVLAAPAWAAEQPVDLAPAPGVEAVEANCGGCHSLDYVRMNAPFLGAEAWKAEVTKMRNAYGAPVTDSDAATIVAYLASNYGPAK